MNLTETVQALEAITGEGLGERGLGMSLLIVDLISRYEKGK